MTPVNNLVWCAALIVSFVGGFVVCMAWQAKTYLSGHASRDPEVAAWKRDAESWREMCRAADEVRREFPNLGSEENPFPPCENCEAEREASRKLVEAAKKTPMPCLKAHQLPRYKSCRDVKNWNTHQEFYCHNCRFLEALEVYATPAIPRRGKGN